MLLAALPTAWTLVAPLVDESVPPDPAYAATSAFLAWLTAFALCAAYHRDASPAFLPAGSPGLLFTGGFLSGLVGRSQAVGVGFLVESPGVSAVG